MKRGIHFILVVAIFLSLLGCSNREQVQGNALTPPKMQERIRMNLPALAGNVAQVSVGWEHIAVLRTDGTVAALGNNEKGQCDVSAWSGVTQIYAGDKGTLGLKYDGTAVATWCDVRHWADVEQVFLGDSGLALGLTSHGRVLVAGTEDADFLAAREWTDMKTVAIQYDTIYGLKTDGTVVFAGLTHDEYWDSCAHCLIPTWNNIEKIFCYDYYLAGVRSDGVVLSSCPEVLHVNGWSNLDMAVTTYPCYFGVSEDGRILTEDMLGVWYDGMFFYSQDHLYPEISVQKADLTGFANLKQLLAWSPGGFLFGLKSDGSLAQFPKGTLDANTWQGIVKLVGTYETMAALREDGTVLTWSAAGYCPDAGSWENVVEVYPVTADGMWEFLGLRADGTLVGTGELASWDLNQLVK